MITYLKNLKIRNKLLLSFAIVLIFYICTVATAVVGVRNITESFGNFHNISYKIVNESTSFRLNQYIVGRDMLQIVYRRDVVNNEEDFAEMKRSINNVEQAIANLEELYTDTEKMAEMKAMYENLVGPRDKVVSLLENEKYDEAMTVYQNEYEPEARQARAFLRDMEATTKEEATTYYESSDRSADIMLKTLVILAIITIIFVSVVWYIISRSITKPLIELKNAAKELSDGNLHSEITYTSKSELGILADSMRETIATLRTYLNEIEHCMTMLGKGKLNYKTNMVFKGDFVMLKTSLDKISTLLSEAMLKISNSAEQVSGGAQQISNGAQMLSQGASEQTGSIEELAANINEISDNVKNNANDTVAASNLADAVEQEILDNSEQMKAVTEAINDIRQTSMNITGIVKEIEDIAFQTNLLSLNAAVEAARAGDAGRGFSVVASEIRKLATKTTDASKITADLIQQSTKSVEEGSALIVSTEESLKHIVDGARNVATKIERISQANIQQANFIVQIRQSIEQISDIVQGNSATSEESAAASEELAAQAQILRDLVNRFEIQERDEI
ncbi:methyl-accepting chemotaxis protein [[Eubacterium] hominis]|uniref:methyl-accepting chemotaxis protein n=1 Tax=[Eubacterium] hominis TaxID=2764325 RepID=UPI003A4DE227